MKRRMLLRISAVGLIAASVGMVRFTALGQEGTHTDEPYSVVSLATLGGSSGAGNSINNRGWVMGAANLAGNESVHATLWLEGLTFDLGTLGGPNSGVEWQVMNGHGLVAGIAETADLDPLGEQWSCSAFFPTVTGHTCLGFKWLDGVMTALPALGGNNGYASGVNQQGQIVGWAETTVHDSTCVSPQVLQFEPVVWDPPGYQAQELAPLHGDPDGAATAINDLGQVVGISGTCDVAVGAFTAAHAVLWQNGHVSNLGNLGGVAWNTPTAINDQGEVVGFSDRPGDQNGVPNFHAFLWTAKTGIKDLGTLPGDVLSEALGVNDLGQIVGLSCTAGFATCRAFLWQNGAMTDLNKLVDRESSLYLVFANSINDRGEISGGGYDQTTGESPAFRAVPGWNSSPADMQANPGADVPRPNLPPMLLPRGFGRIGGSGPR